MNILMVHNRYQQPGGEDVSTDAEVRLLEGHGHSVRRLELHNDEIRQYGPWRRASLAWRTTWSTRGAALVAEQLAREAPDLVHFQNTFPLFSPAVYWPCNARRIPVVQHLRNYRLVCPGATLYRAGSPCQDCLGRAPWSALLHGCYRDSRLQTAPVVGMLQIHRLLGTWRARVDAFIVPSRFARDVLARGGLPADRLHVKPNLAMGGASAVASESPRDYALYLGRLEAQKGVRTLIRAFTGSELPPLVLLGSGPLEAELRAAARDKPAGRIRMLGTVPPEEAQRWIAGALCVVFPSECFETFGRVIVEAYAQAVPVIASRHGAMPELIEEERSGLSFEPGNAAELAACVRRLASEPRLAAEMGSEALNLWRRRFSPEANYQRLLEIYAQAASTCHESRAAPSVRRANP